MPNNPLKQIVLKFFPKAKFLGKLEKFPHTDLIHFKHNSVNYVAKLIEPDILRSCSDKELPGLTNFLLETTLAYYHALKKIGVPVPPYYKIVISDGQVVEFATDLGRKRMDKVLKKIPNSWLQQLMDLYVQTISSILQQKKPLLGFDGAAENFLLFKKTLIFCDFVPARMKYKGKFLVGFPNPSDPKEIDKGFQRYFTAHGILRRVRIHLLNADPNLDDILFASLKNNLPNSIFQKIKCKFDVSDEFKVKNLLRIGRFNKVIELIERTDDTDSLREIAIWVFWLIKKQTMPPKIYDLSRLHLHFSSRERQERLNAFKESIIKAIHR